MKSLFLLLALTAPSFATLVSVGIIDPFDAGNDVVSIRTGSATDVYQDPSAILGGWRQLDVVVVSNPYFRDVRVGAIPETHQFFSETGPLAQATVSLTYDGNGLGLGGIDLTSGGAANSLGLNLADCDPNLTVTLSITDLDGHLASASLFRAEAIEAGEVVYFKFSHMDNAAGTDFTRTDKIVLTVDNGVSGDFTANFVGTFHAPEPGAPMLVAFSTLALAGRRRRV
ncbi:hypothetical protein [Haloferula sargassicola]|uniref:PEP-CTERM protein-sorting domain-containing protein n=1 Tax=Haloferula sargassicola TaxID=490096 RepID=A0ABP9UQD4_9BACT